MLLPSCSISLIEVAFKVGSPRVLKQQGNMNNLNWGKNILGTKNRKKYLGSWEQNNANERKKKKDILILNSRPPGWPGHFT